MTRPEALEMYKIQHERFHKTQDLQWKFNISTWTLMAAAIYFFNQYYNEIHHQKVSSYWIVILTGAFLVTHSMFVLIEQNSLAVTKAVWLKILVDLNDPGINDIRINIKDATKENSLRKSKFWGENWKWIVFQILITLILLFTFVFIYYNHW